MRLSGKVALVTGGGSGIGAAAARLFAREGAAVALMGRRREALDAVVAQIKEARGRAIAIQGDVVRAADCERAVRDAVHAFGALHVLFNNAGTSAVGTALETAEEEFDRVMDINVKGTFLMCKYALPHMIEAGGGSIINTSSVSGIRGNRQRAAYNAAKGAVCNLTKNLALDFGPKGVRANAVLPGLVETDMPKFFQARGGKTWPDVVRENTPKYPLGRIGKPEDVANCVLFLAADESAWITGQLIAVDGGLTAVLM